VTPVQTLAHAIINFVLHNISIVYELYKILDNHGKNL